MVSNSDRIDMERLKDLGMTTLDERRHHPDMLQKHKFLHGLDRMDKKTWFNLASEEQKATSRLQTHGTLNPSQRG
jgi:hypothetical protein